MSVFISIIAVLIILGVLATAHELGHFFVARLFKVKAYEVSIFVGPTLLKWKRKGVEYSLRCIPIGAYVRFSEIDEAGNAVQSDDPALLLNQPRWKRLIIALAGPFVNLVIGVIIFAIYFMSTGFVAPKISDTYEGTQLYEHIQEFEFGDEIVAVDHHTVFTEDDLFIYFQFKSSDEETVLTLKSQETGKKYDITLVPKVSQRTLLGITRYMDVDPTYNAWEINGVEDFQNGGNPILQSGDYLVSVDDIPVLEEAKLMENLDSKIEGDVAHVKFIRNGENMEGDIKVTKIDTVNPLGVVLTPVDMESFGDYMYALTTAMKMPAATFNMTKMVISSAFKGDVEIYNVVSGPVGVVNVVDSVVSDERADAGIKISTLIMLAGMISIALTISNMLPLPGLDGFQLVVLIIEMIIGRKLPQKGENIIAVIGFFVLIALVLFAFASDIAKIVIEGW